MFFDDFDSVCSTVTVTNLSQAPAPPGALKPRLRYKLKHGVVGGEVGGVYYNLCIAVAGGYQAGYLPPVYGIQREQRIHREAWAAVRVRRRSHSGGPQVGWSRRPA